MGHGGPGGAGDLYVHIEMAKHERLQREAEHLIFPAKISFPVAALGGQISVPTLDGPQLVDIKPGTQHGELQRLRGQGMPRLQGSGSGDLVIVYEVVVPKTFTPEAREALAAYARATGEDVPEQHGFFDKIGKIFRGD